MKTRRFVLPSITALCVVIAGTTGAHRLFADDDSSSDDGSEDRVTSVMQWTAPVQGEKSPLPQAIANNNWKTECSSCHMLYHPSLLPERSWKKMMLELENHFGENAALDPETAKEISAFLTANAADKAPGRRSKKILRSIGANDIPVRISEISYITRKHDDISPSVYKRTKVGSAANCMACHKEAERGYFSEDTAHIPR